MDLLIRNRKPVLEYTPKNIPQNISDIILASVPNIMFCITHKNTTVANDWYSNGTFYISLRQDGIDDYIILGMSLDNPYITCDFIDTITYFEFERVNFDDWYIDIKLQELHSKSLNEFIRRGMTQESETGFTLENIKVLDKVNPIRNINDVPVTKLLDLEGAFKA